MFRNVPACSGMFHVPGFIDGLVKILDLSADILLCIYARKMFVFFLRKGNKHEKVNQKPNISSCLTFSEVVLNVWYQASVSKSVGPIF